MLRYPWKDCPWVVRHQVPGQNHVAFRLRAFMLGDFLGQRPARSDFVVNRDGTPADWRKRPVCEGCGKVPKVEDLVVVDRATGEKHFLETARDTGRGGRTTREDRCRWCQDPTQEVNEDRLCPTCARMDAEPEPPPPGPERPPDGDGFAPGDGGTVVGD